MSMFLGFLILSTVCSIDGAGPPGEPKNSTKELVVPPDLPPVFEAFHKAFEEDGFSPEQVDTILLRYYQEGIDTKKWPFTDRAKELLDSVKNTANDNAAKVVGAIEKAGCEATDAKSIEACAVNTIKILDNKEIESSLLQTDAVPSEPVLYNIAQNTAAMMNTVQYLNNGISLTTGSVASNSASIMALSTAAATNAGNIVGLSSAVSSMSQVTGPTVALAGSLGVPVSTVSSMALAGSFVGPLLGVIAIVYAAWPEEEVDPWLKVESRVAQMINDKFDAKRRKRLGDRLRRYVKQFARCSQAWVNDGLVKFHGLSLPRWVVEEAKLAKGQGGNFELSVSKHARNFPAPPCTAQLEGHMALERDEWFKTEKGRMSGLFMPFANMHTQLLSLMADHPHDDNMQWGRSLKHTAAEYGAYMLDHLISAWRAQVCRTMRLRHSLKNGPTRWRYNFVVLKAVVQPHAAEDCSDKCGGQSGWCNFCGGKGEGACCANGDDGGVCKRFDAPVGWHGSKYQGCVHTDCVQSNTGYYGTELQAFGPRENGAPRTSEECRQMCLGITGAVAFTLNSKGMKCTCLAQKRLTRHQEQDAFSGPTVCKTFQDALQDEEDAMESHLNETIKVPVEEVEVCSEKSPIVSDFAELEEKHPDWIQSCYLQAAKAVTIEYNAFYQRFARFVDMLAWKAGCGTQHEVEWEETSKRNGFEVVSQTFDGGSFGDCNWEREEIHDKNMWVFDETRARGWTGTSKVSMEEQSAAKTMYPLPAWLRDLRNEGSCLRQTAAGEGVTDPNNGVSSAIESVMEPASMDESRMQDAPSPNPEYEELLRQMREGGP